MRVSMPRGDIYYIDFYVTAPSEFDDISYDEIYFTVKKKYSDKTFLFQKKLTTGGITKIDIDTYRIKIEPEDTNNLIINKPGESYDFDIELIYQDIIKQTSCGEFVLTKEVTHASDEG